ncbi:MAG: hypothetical protein JXA99_03300 [Candidatus Lokiarchaeota archaeon]|nr:hypothetical protein [Candidatus Lokiarchaeota archaeon]
MSDKKENTEDFLSIWRKKNAPGSERPSVIGDALEELETIKRENMTLRNKINENINLIRNSESVLKNALDERDMYKQQNQYLSDDFQKKIQNLEWLLKQKDEEVELKINQIKNKEIEINELKQQTNQSSSFNQGANSGLVQELQSKITKMNSEIDSLKEENNSLKEKLKNITSSSGSSALETLCQDLQTDLNRYKSMADALKRDNDMMKNMINSKENIEKIDTEDLKRFKLENEELKTRNLELETFINRNKIDDLKKKVEDNKIIIKELKEANKLLSKAAPGAMKGLIDELQLRINKLKIELNDKDRKIKELEK